MAFSRSPQTVRNMMPLLTPFLEGRHEVRWRTDPGKATWFASRVREALFAAKHNAEEFPALAEMKDRISIIVQQPNLVFAIPRTAPAVLEEFDTLEPVARASVDVTATSVSHITAAWETSSMAGTASACAAYGSGHAPAVC
jgi:hypothetical protein